MLLFLVFCYFCDRHVLSGTGCPKISDLSAPVPRRTLVWILINCIPETGAARTPPDGRKDGRRSRAFPLRSSGGVHRLDITVSDYTGVKYFSVSLCIFVFRYVVFLTLRDSDVVFTTSFLAFCHKVFVIIADDTLDILDNYVILYNLYI